MTILETYFDTEGNTTKNQTMLKKETLLYACFDQTCILQGEKSL